MAIGAHLIVRLIHKADFERLLGTPAWSRSAHFSVHHVAALSLVPIWKNAMARAAELSTDCVDQNHKPVDNSAAPAPPSSIEQVVVMPAALPLGSINGLHLGVVVPKRHAKRAVTRSLLKRQMRATFAGFAGQLPAGQWLVRLRQPFSAQQFVSAQSPALRRAVQVELDLLFSQPSPQRGPRRSAPPLP